MISEMEMFDECNARMSGLGYKELFVKLEIRSFGELTAYRVLPAADNQRGCEYKIYFKIVTQNSAPCSETHYEINLLFALRY